MVQATLMYGIGATKAGTSWLHRYFSAHPECAMPVLKELHYFDGLESGSWKRQIAYVDREIARLQEKQSRFSGPFGDKLRTRQARLGEWREILEESGKDPQAYLSYLTRGAEDLRLVGDVTPAYALLPVPRLAQMAALAPVTRFVYILRDPVARIWSNIRMMARRQAARTDEIAPLAHRIVNRVLSGAENEITARSDYASALARLDAAVPSASLFLGLYESLFSQETMARLCRFLGLSEQPADFEKRVHDGVPLKLEDEARFALQRLLAPQYACVEARLGALPEAWQHNMVKA